MKDAENILQESLLAEDIKNIEALKMLGKRLGADLANMLDDKNVSISIVHQNNDGLTSPPLNAVKTAHAENLPMLYKQTADKLRDKAGNDIEMSLSQYENNVFRHRYPKGQSGGSSTNRIASPINPNITHTITIHNIGAVCFRRIYPSVILSFIYVILSLTAVLMLLANLRRSKKLLEIKENFTNNVTHELKTPLSALYASTEALDKYNMIDDRQNAVEYIRIIKSNLDRLSAMTESILQNAALANGHMVLNKEDFNLHDLLTECTYMLRPRLEKLNATIDLSALPESIIINGDRSQLMNVFTNLIDNSLKYVKTEPVVRISASRSEGTVIITFCDNGPGIPSKYRDEIYEPYFRIPEGDLHTVKGHGLGLSHVKAIIGMHYGTITTIDAGTGACFKIVIPGL